MAIATYAELVSEVTVWLFSRPDIADRVPSFIRMFEAKMNRTLFVRQMEERAGTVIDLGSTEPEFVTLPGLFQTMRRVRLTSVTGKPRLKFATAAQMDDFRNARDNLSGQPIWFSISGDEMELCPTPDRAYAVEMVYRKNIPPLSATSGYTTNWLLDFAPDMYLYGALMEAAPYLHEDERIATWASGLAAGVDQLNKLSEQALYNAGPLVMRRKGSAYG